ncbi:MAG: tetratricopeptide repeat protein [Paracoccus sp. (in: a-proteobacteria)]
MRDLFPVSMLLVALTVPLAGIAQEAADAADGQAAGVPALNQEIGEGELSPEGIAATLAAENAATRPDVDDATLADMQANLRAVSADLQTLRAELLVSGAAGFAAAGGDSAIDRMNRMEAQIAVLTDQIEQMSNRIRRIVTDGTNRIGDIEFRLCELDQNCDLGALMTAELGRYGTGRSVSGAAIGQPSVPSDISAVTLPPMNEPEPVITPPTEEEAREFAEARATVDAGEWQAAIAQLDHLVSGHAGGPLTAEALFLRGVAQQASGQVPAAAESWLQAFAAAPDGPQAAASLMSLSQVMRSLGEAQDACPYLTELIGRFPDAAEAEEARMAASAASCTDYEALMEEEGAER